LSEPFDPDISLPFPIELPPVRDTPLSLQSKNGKAREAWKRKIGEIANAHVKTLRDFYYLDNRPLAVTIFYFPPAEMVGDVDNIVKLILDGMDKIVYPSALSHSN